MRSRPQPAWSTYPQALDLVAHGATIGVAGRVALLVGTILSAVNQGSVIVAGESGWVTWAQSRSITPPRSSWSAWVI